MKHTPTPWEVLNGCAVMKNRRVVASVYDPDDHLHIGATCKANAEFIVRAVNNHDRLIEVIEKGIRINRHGAYQDELEVWRSEAEAALAAAKEES